MRQTIVMQHDVRMRIKKLRLVHGREATLPSPCLSAFTAGDKSVAFPIAVANNATVIRFRMFFRLQVAVLFGISWFACVVDAQIDRIIGRTFATRSEVLARHGMVCTSVPLATQVGLDVLKRGGSAVDAAIAANATLGLMEPVSNGIGGDLFAIVYSAKENKLYGLNGSGRSPLGLSYDGMKAELAKLKRETIPPRGMLPISVPGCVDGWAELHKNSGSSR